MKKNTDSRLEVQERFDSIMNLTYPIETDSTNFKSDKEKEDFMILIKKLLEIKIDCLTHELFYFDTSDEKSPLFIDCATSDFINEYICVYGNEIFELLFFSKNKFELQNDSGYYGPGEEIRNTMNFSFKPVLYFLFKLNYREFYYACHILKNQQFNEWLFSFSCYDKFIEIELQNGSNACIWIAEKLEEIILSRPETLFWDRFFINIAKREASNIKVWSNS